MSTLTPAAVRAVLDTDDPKLSQRITEIKISTRRKSIGWSMKPGDAGLTVHLPASIAAPDAVARLSANRHRIGHTMATVNRLPAPQHPVKELVNGSGFAWLGLNNRLRLVDQPAAPVRHTDDHGRESESGTWCGRWLEMDRGALHLGAQPIIDWYTREGTAWLERNAPQLWSRMALRQTMPHVRADDIGRRRWGVHAQKPDPADDTIRIAWQVFQLPLGYVRHVLTHELTHATRPGGKPHGREFWRAFEHAEPGARKRQNELDQQGATVWMGDIHAPAPATR